MVSSIRKKILRDIEDSEYHRWPIDVFRVKTAFMQNLKTGLSTDDVTRVWEEISGDYCAGWLTLPEQDSELWLDYIEPWLNREN